MVVQAVIGWYEHPGRRGFDSARRCSGYVRCGFFQTIVYRRSGKILSDYNLRRTSHANDYYVKKRSISVLVSRQRQRKKLRAQCPHESSSCARMYRPSSERPPYKTSRYGFCTPCTSYDYIHMSSRLCCCTSGTLGHRALPSIC